MRGTGGLPPRRLDQQRNVSPPSVAPGAAAGITRARIVEVIGGPNSGVFVYSGQPGIGDLIASLAGNTTADLFGNTVVPNSLTFYGTTQGNITIGLEGGGTFVQFATEASFEGTPANLSAGVAGSGAAAQMQLNISGPKGNSPNDDWVQMEIVSNNQGGTSAAQIFYNYIDESGGVHAWAILGQNGFSIQQGSINGITPEAGTLANPGPAAGNPPSGSGTASASTVAGSLLSYFDALATTYNETVTSVADLVNLLLSWGV